MLKPADGGDARKLNRLAVNDALCIRQTNVRKEALAERGEEGLRALEEKKERVVRGDGGTQARMRAAGRAVEGMKIVGGVLQQTGI